MIICNICRAKMKSHANSVSLKTKAKIGREPITLMAFAMSGRVDRHVCPKCVKKLLKEAVK